MKDLISDIVKALVDQPDQVLVNQVEGCHTVVLELSVAKSDMGKVIGKKGRNAQAIRTILSSAKYAKILTRDKHTYPIEYMIYLPRRSMLHLGQYR